MRFPDQYHFYFFGNKKVNALYLTLALRTFGVGLIGIFVPIYLWELGFPLWRIISFYFLNSLFMVVLTFSLLPLLRRLSDKMMMFLSIPPLILYFLGLSFIQNREIFFYILPAIDALHLLFFWSGYHLCFSSSVDDGYIGREVGVRFMVSAFSGLAAPFLGGLLIASVGFQESFFVGSAILFLAIVPLFFFPQRNFAPHLYSQPLVGFLRNKSLRPFYVASVGYATERMVGLIVWPLFIFLSIGAIQKLGGIVSLGLLVGAVTTYVIGFLSDKGKRRKVLMWSAKFQAFIWIARSLLRTPVPIIASHFVESVVYPSLLVSWSSQYYKIARAVSNSDLFILSRETLFHISRVLFLPILAVLAYLLPLNVFFIASFVIAAALSLLFLFANRLHLNDLQDGFLNK